MKKKLLAFVLCLTMMLSLLPMGVFAAESESITYIERTWDELSKKVIETEKECNDYELVTADTTEFRDGRFYVVDGEFSSYNRINVNGTAYMILKNGCRYTAYIGMQVSEGNTLVILGQRGDSGTFVARREKVYADTSQGAGIGGNQNGNTGTIIISGGTVTAYGRDAGAAIGSGGWGKSDGSIVINGGIVNATGGVSAAAIGSGRIAGFESVMINGGTVTASSVDGAAIGSGSDGSIEDVVINGGTITAVCEDGGAGVGSGKFGSVQNITINGGSIDATSKYGAGVGAGSFGGSVENLYYRDGIMKASGNPCISVSNIYLSGTYGRIRYGNDENNIIGEFDSTSADIAETLLNYKYAFVYDHSPVKYIERSFINGKVIPTIKTVSDYNIFTSSIEKFENNAYYVVINDVTSDNRIEVSGNTHLILTDGSSLAVKGGIAVSSGNTLNIYGQCKNTGVLTTRAYNDGASIGGDAKRSNGSIYIHGGTVNAHASFDFGAAIGAGAEADGNTSEPIVIYGGIVNASAVDSAAIGGPKVAAKTDSVVIGTPSSKPKYGSGGKVELYGGKLTAYSVTGFAIGGGEYDVVHWDGIFKDTTEYVYGKAAILYMNPDIKLMYGDASDSATNILTSTSATENIGGVLQKVHYEEYKADNISEDTHQWTAATCSEPKTCSVCGETDGKALGHNFTRLGALITPATCINKAVYVAQCTRCDETNGTMETGGLGDHKYVATKKVSDPTCISPEIYNAKCSVCGETTEHFEVGEPLGHAYVFDSKGAAKCRRCSATPPKINITGDVDSCEIVVGDLIKPGVVIRPYENGYDAYMSVDVDGKYVGTYNPYKKYTVPEYLRCVSKSVVDKYGNFDIEFETVCLYTEATCKDPATCVYCGEINGEALGHDFTKQGVLITPATCTDKAIYAVQCTRCDEINGTMEAGEPAGHKYVATEKVSDPTCISPAIYNAKCSVCGETTEHFEVGEPLGHSYVIDSKGVAKCKRCSATPPTANITTNIDSCNIAVGDIIKAGVVINPYENNYDAYMATTVDGKFVGVFTPYKKYTAPTCLKCVSKSSIDRYGNFDIYFESACLYTEATCQTPATCVYCGATKGEIGSHNVVNGVCTVCGAHFEAFEFDAKSLALDSALAFRFKGYLYDPNPAEDAYMEFKIGDIRSVNVPLSDAVKDEKGRYVFTCYLNVLEVDEKIEAIFHDGEVSVERKNPLSVTDYLDQVLANHTGGTAEDASVINLVNAISNYAHYAQIALDETHTEYEVGNGGKYVGTAARTDISLHSADELAQFAAVKNVSDGFTAVKSTSRSLVLDDETAIVVYITPENTDYVPTVKVTDKDGNNVAFTCEKQENGKYKVVIRGIAAHKLGDAYTVDVDNGKLTYTNLSALSYAHSILSGNKSEAYKNAVSALYDYYIATTAYKG